MTVIGNRDDAFLSIGCEFSFSVDEIAVSLFIFSTDTATKLMQLRESKIFRIEDDDGIGRQEVYSIFYYGGCEEDVVFSLFECVDAVFYLVSVESSVSDNYFCFILFIQYHLDFFFDTFHPTDAVNHHDHLSSTIEFISDRMTYRCLIPGRDDGFYWFFEFWGSGEKGDFFESRKREIQTSGYWCRRKRENIDIGPDFFDSFLMTYSELMFLIDHEESEFFPCYILGKKSVCSDNDIDVSIFHICERISCFTR